MNLTDDAMQVSLRITAWSGRRHDREASDHVALAHDAAASAGRYHKRLLPKAAFAALTATVSEARTRHYENTLPWDDQGSRLLTVANYAHYTTLMDGLRERMVRERARFIADYEDHIDQARLDLGRLFRIDDYPSKEALQGKFSLRYRITEVSDPEHFMAKLATDDVTRNPARHSSATSRSACTAPWATSTAASARPSSASPTASRRTRTASRSCSGTP